MTSIRSNAGSLYMQWAKINSPGKYNLATSGMANLPLSELGANLQELEINGPTIYIEAKRVLASYFAEDEVVALVIDRPNRAGTEGAHTEAENVACSRASRT